MYVTLTVRAEIYLIRQLCNVHLKPVLDITNVTAKPVTPDIVAVDTTPSTHYITG